MRFPDVSDIPDDVAKTVTALEEAGYSLDKLAFDRRAFGDLAAEFCCNGLCVRIVSDRGEWFVETFLEEEPDSRITKEMWEALLTGKIPANAGEAEDRDLMSVLPRVEAEIQERGVAAIRTQLVPIKREFGRRHRRVMEGDS